MGALLIEYRQEMVQWMTVTIGVLFFLSGVIATTMAYATGRIQKRIYKDFENNTDAELSDNISAPRKSRGWCWGMAAGRNR